MKFKVGDVVTVKDWEEMEKEFGVVGKNINCPGTFSHYMKPLCGKSGVVVKCNEDVGYYSLRPMSLKGLRLDWQWDFTDAMLKE